MTGVVMNAGAQGGISPELIAQEPGNSPTLLMSQKAITDFVNSQSLGPGAACVDVPQFTQEITYTGEELVPVFLGFYEDAMDIGGTVSAVNAGRYTVTFVLKPGYSWSDGTRGAMEVEWEIRKAPGRCVLSQSSVTAIKGSSSSVTVTRSENAEIIVSSNDSGIANGAVSGNVVTILGNKRGQATLTVQAAETMNYTAASAELTVSVCEAVQVPVQSGTLTYNGSAQSPTWTGYTASSESMTMSGTTTGVNAGDYVATFALNDGFCWSDGSRDQKTARWSIARKTGTLTISKDSIQMLGSGVTQTFTVTCDTDGTLSVISSAPNTAAASLSGNTVTVTSKAIGSAEITVSASETTNYTAPASKTCAVSVMQKSQLKPADIQAIIDNEQEENTFLIGDLFPIKFNGKMSDGLTLNNATYYACIIGINHNREIEGDHRVHFKVPYDANGRQLAFVDSMYNTWLKSGKYFNMNNAPEGSSIYGGGTNAGGYVASNFKKNIVPLIWAAMDSSWRNAISSCTKYSDNAPVSATQEDIWLIDGYEYFGIIKHALSTLQDYQKQYQYYINGNSKIHYAHNNSATAVGVWMRSRHNAVPENYTYNDPTYEYYSNFTSYSYGVSLGFTVAKTA